MYSNDQLCFSCAKACGNCSWSSQLIPVDGWIAENTVLPNGIESFSISKCPEYEFDGLCTRRDDKRGRNYTQTGKRGLIKKMAGLQNATFISMDYKEVIIPNGSVKTTSYLLAKNTHQMILSVYGKKKLLEL